jgi:DHA1 family bicyclomycin/chloramphenicol resistance-like MFS transporter
MPATLVVLILSMLLGLQPVTTDLYLPALPGLTREFGAAINVAQITLTALLLAFGISQLFWGPLSDRFGRRPILLTGMVLYVIAATASCFAPSIGILIFCRTVQGIAMGAAVMCARAVVRDLFHPTHGVSVMSKAQSGLGVIACISAPLGGLLTATWGWRGTLAALAVFGSLTLLLIALRFKETVPNKNTQALQITHLLRTWVHILRNPTFLAFTSLTISAYGGLFTYLVSSSFVFIEVLQWSSTEYGLLMLSLSMAYLAGTFVCRYLLRHHGLRHAVRIAALLSLGAGCTMGILALTGLLTAWSIILPLYGFTVSYGIHQPCSQTSAIAPFPESAGTASALNGFLMMLVAFVSSLWMREYLQGTLNGLAYGIWFWSVCIAISAWILIPRYARS